MLADSSDKPHYEDDAASTDDDAEGARAQVRRAQQGDPIVWEAWFDEYYPRLYRYAYFRMRRATDAEDIVGQVFLEAVRGIDKYRYQGRPILAWLYRIAHNLIADRFKREASRQTKGGEPASSVDHGPEELIENLDLLRALEELTEEQREVVVLRFFAGMTAKEVAALLEKSEPAVFSLQSRALVALRERLGDGSGI